MFQQKATEIYSDKLKCKKLLDTIGLNGVKHVTTFTHVVLYIHGVLPDDARRRLSYENDIVIEYDGDSSMTTVKFPRTREIWDGLVKHAIDAIIFMLLLVLGSTLYQRQS